MLPDALDVLRKAIQDGDRHAALALLKLARVGEVDFAEIGPTDADRVQTDQLRQQPRVRTPERLAELVEIALKSRPVQAHEDRDVSLGAGASSTANP